MNIELGMNQGPVSTKQVSYHPNYILRKDTVFYTMDII